MGKRAETASILLIYVEVSGIVLDHFDPKGGHEELYVVNVDQNYRPVCRGGNYYDVPGNARIAVRLGLQGGLATLTHVMVLGLSLVHLADE